MFRIKGIILDLVVVMRLLFVLFLLLTLNCSYSQIHSLEGVWQGVFTTYLEKPSEGHAIWMEFRMNTSTGEFDGESRHEMPYKELFAYKKMNGKIISDSSIHFNEYQNKKKKETSHLIWCLNEGDLVYNKETGYLEGGWRSTDCKSPGGRITMYRSTYELSKTDTNSLYHSWFDNFVGDLSRGWKAYYVRDAEMRDFQFVPVYFDHDKDVLKINFKK